MIKLSNVECNYRNSTQHWCYDVRVSEGERVAVIGASGTGKSTLLGLIAGFITPTRGTIELNGTHHTQSLPFERPVSILFQNHNLFNHMSVFNNIALGVTPDLKVTDTQRNAIQHTANQLGIGTVLNRLPDTLSGGQQQRVALARCMVRDKPILLLDEPFSALDKSLREDILVHIQALCQERHITLLMVTHQPEEIEHAMDRVICMNTLIPEKKE